MAFLEINPKYQDFLRRHGLAGADEFLQLPAVVISGHPDRHVAQVSIGQGPDAVAGFLKREHRVRWKDRVANACAGFGFVSKSVRESLVLQLLPGAGIGCPEWLAVGEDDRGRAFLLVRELAGCLDLRVFLRQLRAATPRERYRFARRLGEVLARLHDAGFVHGDLYAKHTLVDSATGEVLFLDWQRSSYRTRVGWRQRRRDLAALQATLADDLVRPRERLACLRAYLRGTGRQLRRRASSVRRLADALLRRRHVREQRQPPLGTGTQNLIWVDGEALCVTREFWARCRGQVPRWLNEETEALRPQYAARLTSERVALPGGSRAVLVRRRVFLPFAWLWGRLRRKRPTSPELRQAGILFRLQRYGIPTPRLLAVGQRETAPGWLESFLLVEPPADTVPLTDWLAEHDDRGHLFEQGLALLRRLHEAGCHFGTDGAGAWRVRARPGEPPSLILGSVAGLSTGRRPAGTDVAWLQREFARFRPARECLAGR
jgi:tRNA A-37 threonylcarbamoyl transferase component Bud32